MTIVYRRASEYDLDKIVELQDKNLVSVLVDSDKADGFLSGSFTAQQFGRMNEDLGIAVCLEGAELLGFLCAGTVEYNRAFGLPAAMIARYPLITYRGRTLDQWQSYVAGPVCVAREQRGKGIFVGLYDQIFQLLPQEYELTVTLVSLSNPRSIQAHKKVGLESVDEFKFDGRDFTLMVRPVRI
jgi:hypothetical protein